MTNLFDGDPGRRNEILKADTPAQHFLVYTRRMAQLADLVDHESLNHFVKLLSDCAQRKAKIYVAGNGGSAAIGDHLCCDFAKGTFHPQFAPLRPHSLTANTAVYSAFANDFGFENVFSSALDIYADPKDVLIAISSSGKSTNIVNAVEKAKEIGLSTVGLTGFDGGEVKKLVEISLHVPVNNYGLVEDCHQMIMHSAAQFLSFQRQQTAENIK